jgi:hypothetical protein
MLGLSFLVLALSAMGLPSLSGEPAANDLESRGKKVVKLFQNQRRLTPARVQKELGQPQRKARQILHRRAIELWHYGPPLWLDVTISWPRGRAPLVTSVHLARNRKP